MPWNGRKNFTQVYRKCSRRDGSGWIWMLTPDYAVPTRTALVRISAENSCSGSRILTKSACIDSRPRFVVCVGRRIAMGFDLDTVSFCDGAFAGSLYLVWVVVVAVVVTGYLVSNFSALAPAASGAGRSSKKIHVERCAFQHNNLCVCCYISPACPALYSCIHSLIHRSCRSGVGLGGAAARWYKSSRSLG